MSLFFRLKPVLSPFLLDGVTGLFFLMMQSKIIVSKTRLNSNPEFSETKLLSYLMLLFPFRCVTSLYLITFCPKKFFKIVVCTVSYNEVKNSSIGAGYLIFRSKNTEPNSSTKIDLKRKTKLVLKIASDTAATFVIEVTVPTERARLSTND